MQLFILKANERLVGCLGMRLLYSEFDNVMAVWKPQLHIINAMPCHVPTSWLVYWQPHSLVSKQNTISANQSQLKVYVQLYYTMIWFPVYAST